MCCWKKGNSSPRSRKSQAFQFRGIEQNYIHTHTQLRFECVFAVYRVVDFATAPTQPHHRGQREKREERIAKINNRIYFAHRHRSDGIARQKQRQKQRSEQNHNNPKFRSFSRSLTASGFFFGRTFGIVIFHMHNSQSRPRTSYVERVNSARVRRKWRGNAVGAKHSQTESRNNNKKCV